MLSYVHTKHHANIRARVALYNDLVLFEIFLFVNSAFLELVTRAK